jgi:hypothetical protein
VTEANETDFLPWILGASVFVASIIAIVIASSARTTSSPPVLAARYAPAKAGVQAAALPAIAVQATSHQALPPGRVWQCAVNSQRIFSDSPCGTTSTIRQLSETNRMDPTPVSPSTYYNPPSPSDAPDYTQSYDNSANDASVCEGLKEALNAIHERMRHLYTNPEGNDFRARLREISDRQGELHCDR